MHVFRLRCVACGRKLGRWELWRHRDGWGITPLGRRGTTAYGRGEIIRDDAWWPRPANPGFRWNNLGKLDQLDVIDATCSCQQGWGRRRVRITATGLARRLGRLGWPPEIDL